MPLQISENNCEITSLLDGQ